MEGSLEQLTEGLASLGISQTSAHHNTVTSIPVGGARPKVRLSPEKVTCKGEVKAESGEVTAEQSQSAESTELQSQVTRKCDESLLPQTFHLSVISFLYFMSY